MKRIVLIATAVAGLFTAGITTAASAARTPATTRYVTVTETKLKRESTTATAHATCRTVLTTVAPTGSSTVTPGMPSGYQYGATRCTKLGAGTTRIHFDNDASGQITGTIQHWFRGGTVYGTFSLTQSASNGPPTATSFTSSTDAGSVELMHGQGLLKGASGGGTLRCTTPDGTHWTCTESVKLTQTVTVLKPVSVRVRVRVGS